MAHPAGVISVLALLGALGRGGGAPGEDPPGTPAPPDPERETKKAGEPKKPLPTGKTADAGKAADPGKAAGKKSPADPKNAPPRWVKLPEAGERKASEIFALARVVFGRPIVPDNPKTGDMPVLVAPQMAGQGAGREERTVLLGAHGIYLVEHENEEGPVLVASRDPRWTPERSAPRFVK